MASNLPDYVASARPVPAANRIAWYKSTAQTYAGIMLWFVFWTAVPAGEGTPGGTLAHGLGPAFLGLIAAALLCHFLYYLAPGLLGMKTGLPLYIVGTSTYGVLGGFILPGFLMGLLQFGWLGVNAFFSGQALVAPFGIAAGAPVHLIVASLFAVAAAFMGLKGIQYVARVASFLPLIPLAILLILFFASVGGVGSFDPQKAVDAQLAAAKAAPGAAPAAALTQWGVIAMLLIYVIGFFATAGAAGADFGMNNRDAKDVQLGGLVGIAGATIFAGGLALLIVAGAHGAGSAPAGVFQATALMDGIVGKTPAAIFNWLLAVAAFPPACFSAFIAANSFKTTLPKVNPFVSVGLGTLGSIILVVTGFAGKAADVFTIIGASFGPICGAMAADYLLAGKKWAGPRAGFNPAGWVSWAVGFIVGAAKFIGLGAFVPVPPLSAFVVGFVLYYALAKAGMVSQTLSMPAGEKPQAEIEAAAR